MASKDNINDYTQSQPRKVRDWIARADKYMRDVGCRVSCKVVSNDVRTDAKFTYTSKHTKKTVCYINIGTSGCNISLRGFHFMNPGSTTTMPGEYPDIVLPMMRGLDSCGCRLPDHSINPNNYCVHGIRAAYMYEGEKFSKCLYGGFDFSLNEATDFDMLTRWIELEATFDGKVEQTHTKLPDVPEFAFGDIDISDEYLNGRDKARCINALWSVYNVMKKISTDSTHKTTFYILYHLCKSAVFKDDNFDTLICTDAFSPGKWLTNTNYQYSPEKYGFVYSDFVYRDGAIPKKKTDLRQIKQLTLSYNREDFEDVLFGMMLFVEINAKQSWPYFYNADVRIACKDWTINNPLRS